MIEGDVFRIVVKVPEYGQTEINVEVAGEVTGEVLRLLNILAKCPLTRAEIQSALELKGQANFRYRYLEPALKMAFIEMTIPDKPKSSKQKYRLTEAGCKIREKGEGTS